LDLSGQGADLINNEKKVGVAAMREDWAHEQKELKRPLFRCEIVYGAGHLINKL